MRRSHVIAATTIALLGGCQLEPPFERSNPFDPDGIAELRIEGPDSTHSIGERFVMRLESSHPMPPGDLLVGWRSANPVMVTGGTGGEYSVLNATAEFASVTLRAELGDVVISRSVLVGQSAATVLLSCSPSWQPVDPCDDVPAPVGSSVDIHLLMTDANTNVLRSAQVAVGRAAIVSRDAAVVTPGAQPVGPGYLRVTAMGAGTTWVVVRVDHATDSIRVAVAP